MNKQEKIAVVEELEKKFGSAQSLILADFKGLTVENVNRLRCLMREQNVEYRVVKNTFLKRALKNIEGIEQYLTGSTAVAIGYDDPAVAAKILSRFIKENPDDIRIKAGVVGSKVYDEKMVESLAELPGRDELLAKLMGVMKAPMNNFVSVLQAPVRDLAVVLSAVAGKKGAEA